MDMALSSITSYFTKEVIHSSSVGGMPKVLMHWLEEGRHKITKVLMHSVSVRCTLAILEGECQNKITLAHLVCFENYPQKTRITLYYLKSPQFKP